MLEFAAVQQIAHKLENVFDLLRKDRMPLTESGINLLFEGRDVLTALVRAAIAGGAEPAGRRRIRRAARRVRGRLRLDRAGDRRPARRRPTTSESSAPLDDARVAAFQADVERMLAEATKAATAHRRRSTSTTRKPRSTPS